MKYFVVSAGKYGEDHGVEVFSTKAETETRVGSLLKNDPDSRVMVIKGEELQWKNIEVVTKVELSE